MTRPLFVYGTLLPALAKPRQAALTARLPRLGPATVAGRLYDLGPYPVIVLDPAGTARVRGELFGPPDDADLAALDAYEQYDPANSGGSLFVRVETTATDAAGRAVPCWLWTYNSPTDGATPIDDGDYVAWVNAGRGRPDYE
jgi:gamma-glutamylcyclotransferase (GGCT)/AIG2-like uncharacterized protein YtfP